MAVRNFQLGLAEETTYGTRVAPTRFLVYSEESLALSIDRLEAPSLKSGTNVLPTDRWAAGKKSVAGDITFPVASKGFGMVFKNMLGSVTITTPGGATNTRLHSHVLGNQGSLTIQVGRPDIANTSRPFDYLGAIINSWTLSNDVDGFLNLRVGVDAQDEKTDQSLASASYATGDELFSFVGGSVTVGGSATHVSNISVDGNANLKTDRYFIRNSALKKQPLANALYEITGTMAAEFEDLTAYNRFVNGTEAEVVALWEGSTIEGAFKYHVKVTLPSCRFDGSTPSSSGFEVVQQELPFKVLDDGTNEPITLEYQTTDTAS